MEISAFFRFLYKNSSVLVLIPAITLAITYFLVKSLPDSYVSQAQISTGIVDKSAEINLTNAPAMQPAEIEQTFSNLIQMMQMQRLLALVSYKLIIHDLTSPTPFKKNSSLIEALSPVQREEIVKIASAKYKSQAPLDKSNKSEQLLSDALNSMKYDPGSIKDKLGVYRVAQSDYITVSFDSPNADLSAFTVNNVCSEFINYHTTIVRRTGERSVNYLSSLLQRKQEDLNHKMSILKYYKIRNNVLNLPEQAKIIFGEMIGVENQQSELQKEIISVAGAIREIDNKFNARDRRYFEAAASKVNSQIVTFKEKSKMLSDKYIDSDFDPAYKKAYDSLQVLTTIKINEATDEAIFNPFAVKQDLISKKIGLQTQLDLARNSVSSLERRHNHLFLQFRRLVPFEASIQSFERDIEIASQEYLDILDRYNNTSLQTTFVAKLKLTQQASPGALQPSKKMLLIVLSGVISFVFCVVILFVLFFIDDSIQTPKQLANKTALPVIGQLEKIPYERLNINDLWNGSSGSLQFKNFKDQLRAIRLELNVELPDAKVISICSLGAGEGKTFVALNLAYAYAVTNKKILVIDGNFEHPELTRSIKPGSITYIEDFLISGEFENDKDSAVTILGNKGGTKSILEIINQSTTYHRMEQLKSKFDLIVIEIPALVSSESSKEWMLFTDKAIGVYQYKEHVSEIKKEQVNYLISIERQFVGWIFNKIPVEKPRKAAANKLQLSNPKKTLQAT